MNDKTMVSDALVGVNGELKMFGDMIPQTENKELKQCLKQIRNDCEMSQENYMNLQEKKLLCSGTESNSGRNKSCEIYLDTTCYEIVNYIEEKNEPARNLLRAGF